MGEAQAVGGGGGAKVEQIQACSSVMVQTQSVWSFLNDFVFMWLTMLNFNLEGLRIPASSVCVCVWFDFKLP